MTRACVPSMSTQVSNNHTNNNGTDIPSVNSMSFYKLIEESRWLYQVDLNMSFLLKTFFVSFFLVTKNLNDKCIYRSI